MSRVRRGWLKQRRRMAAEGSLADGHGGGVIAALESVYRDLLFPKLLGGGGGDAQPGHICEFALGSLVNEVRSGTVPFLPDGRMVVQRLLAELKGAHIPPLLAALVEAGGGAGLR